MYGSRVIHLNLINFFNPRPASNCKLFGEYNGAYTPELAQHPKKSLR